MKLVEKDTFFIMTFGCAYNKVDSQIMKDQLINQNYVETVIDNANFIIVNTCAVKGVTENKIIAQLKKLNSDYSNRNFIIAGCLPHISDESLEKIRHAIPSFSAIIDVNCVDQIHQIINEIKSGRKNIIKRSKKKIDKTANYLNYNDNEITAIIPIAEGCLGLCKYCCVKRSRGELVSFSPNNILRQIEYQLKSGKLEIFLTAQDCSSYRNSDINLIGLVKKILSLNQKNFLRIGMINPKFFIEVCDDFINLYKHEKLYKFLHIPIQSGSNAILKKMERGYKIEDLKPALRELRKNIPNVTISTDIICGFPGEENNDFLETISFIEWLKPEILNISKFSPRPGTPAKYMKQINSKVIKERSILLSKVYNQIKSNQLKKWQNWQGEVLITKRLKNNRVMGKNIFYKSIIFKDGELGTFSNARIENISDFKLIGEIT